MKSLSNPEDAQALMERIAALRGDERAEWGEMSVGEMVCHCREAFRGAAGGRPLTGKRGAIPGPVMKRLALRMPMRWPQGVATVDELKVGQPGMIPAEFAQDRAELLSEVERFSKSQVANPHPIFGAMTTADWMRWGYLHTDHHLRQFGH